MAIHLNFCFSSLKNSFIKIVLFFGIFLSLNSFSQDVIEISPKDAGLKSQPNPVGFFRADDGILYRTEKKAFTKENRFKQIIERYNEDLSLKFSNTLEFPDDREEIDNWQFLNDKIFLFSTIYKEGKKSLNLKILDKETGKIISEKKEISSLDSDPFGQMGRIFSISVNQDKSKMLIVSAFQWNKKPQDVKGKIYEIPSMKELLEFKFPDTYNNYLIKTFNYVLTSEGNILYMLRYDIKEKDAPNSQAFVLYNTKDKTSKYKDLELGTKSLTETKSLIKNGVLYRTCGYQDKISKKEKKAGVCCMAINLKDVAQTNVVFDAFPTDIEAKLSYKDGDGKRELGEKEISTTGIYQTSNGFYFVQNLTYTKEITGSQARYIISFSRDFIISKYNFEGKREFVRSLPKYCAKNMYGSDIIECNNNLFVFYCDHPKNLEKYTLENYDPKDYDDIGDIRGPIPVAVKVTADGKLTRQTFEKNESWCYYPGYGVKLGENALLAPRIMKDEYTLTVFKIKK